MKIYRVLKHVQVKHKNTNMSASAPAAGVLIVLRVEAEAVPFVGVLMIVPTAIGVFVPSFFLIVYTMENKLPWFVIIIIQKKKNIKI